MIQNMTLIEILKLWSISKLYKYVIRIKNDNLRMFLKQRILNKYQKPIYTVYQHIN